MYTLLFCSKDMLPTPKFEDSAFRVSLPKLEDVNSSPEFGSHSFRDCLLGWTYLEESYPVVLLR